MKQSLKPSAFLLFSAWLVLAAGGFSATAAGQADSDGDHVRAGNYGLDIEEARHLAHVHGLTGLEPLQPSMRDRIVVGRLLPDDVYRQAVPPEMRARMPRVPLHEWIISGTDLLFVGAGADNRPVVVRIMPDVFR